jgi:hypothetical protein
MAGKRSTGARLAGRRLAVAAALLTILSPGVAAARTCALLAQERAEGAKLKVYFTRFLKEDNSGGRYRGCRLLRRPEEGATPFFVTPFREDADVVVHRDNWPG